MPRCFECGSEAEYVGLTKVENCSNPRCRYYGGGGGLPAGRVESLTLAVDPVTGGAAELNAGVLKVPGRQNRRLITRPDPPLRAAGSGMNCTDCWAFNGAGCRKYARPELPRQAPQLVCDNFEWPPCGARAQVVVDIYAKKSMPPLGLTITPSHVVWADPPGFAHHFHVHRSVDVPPNEARRVTLVALWVGCAHNIPAHSRMGFEDSVLNRHLSIVNEAPGCGGTDPE